MACKHLAKEVVGTGVQGYTCLGEQLAQRCLIYASCFHVFGYLRRHPFAYFHKPLISALGIGIKIEVATGKNGMCGVAACQNVKVEGLQIVSIHRILQYNIV